jgi:hypothetical protein
VGSLLIFLASSSNPLPTSPCKQGEELMRPMLWPPPLLAGEGWGGIALDLLASSSSPLPTSPCKQGRSWHLTHAEHLSFLQFAELRLYAAPIHSVDMPDQRQ